jgi:carboxymethylenebutenolidase
MRIPVVVMPLMLVASLALTAVPAGAAAKPTVLPPPEDSALVALNRSPRHGEWVDVDYPGHAPLKTWIVFPERPDKAGVVLVIHEVFGLTDWIRSVADQLAAEGFIAVAPDLISGLGPSGGGTDSTRSRDDAVKLVRWLSPEESMARIEATRNWAVSLPSANGKLATLGFCWGGGRSFAASAMTPPPRGCVVYYGTAPDSALILKVRAPVLAHYGGDDARVNSTIDAAKTVLQKQHVSYETHIYPGAGHGFLRQQTLRDGANLKASAESWPRTIAFLRSKLK